MRELIEKYKQEVLEFKSNDKIETDKFRIKFMSKNGVLNELFSKFKEVDSSEKKEIGLLINSLKNIISAKIKQTDKINKNENKANLIDFTLPSNNEKIGSLHPLTIVENKIINIFRLLGFNLETGPEIEDDWHNFTALNMPDNHPARDMQDTFYKKISGSITTHSYIFCSN